jgi:hypothetical protein
MLNGCLVLIFSFSLSVFAAPAAAPPELDGPSVTPENLAKAQKLCKLTEVCNKTRPGQQAYCLKTNLKESGLLDHVMEGDSAKDLARFLRREGFVEMEFGLKDFKSLPDSAILVLDAHDPVKDKKPLCPKVYGNVVVKCGDHWIDEQKYELDFHMTRGCRSKGIWIKPELIPPKPKAKPAGPER